MTRRWLKLDRKSIEYHLERARKNVARARKHGYLTAHGKPVAYWEGQIAALRRVLNPIIPLMGEER